MCIWLKTAKAEVIKDQAFLKLLADLQDSLAKDGLQLQLTSLSTYLAESIKSSSAGSSANAGTPVSSGHSQFSFLRVSSPHPPCLCVSVNGTCIAHCHATATPPARPSTHYCVHSLFVDFVCVVLFDVYVLSMTGPSSSSTYSSSLHFLAAGKSVSI